MLEQSGSNNQTRRFSSKQNPGSNIQADFTNPEDAAAKKASRSLKKYSYRGVELDQLLDLSNEDFIGVSFISTMKIGQWGGSWGGFEATILGMEGGVGNAFWQTWSSDVLGWRTPEDNNDGAIRHYQQREAFESLPTPYNRPPTTPCPITCSTTRNTCQNT